MHEVEESIHTVAAQIKKGGQKINMKPKIEVQNIVASSDLESEINLNAIAVTLGLDRVEYEPEQFPGLVCRIEDPKVVVLLFGSGKLVCTRRAQAIGRRSRRQEDHEGAPGRGSPALNQEPDRPACRCRGVYRSWTTIVISLRPARGWQAARRFRAAGGTHLFLTTQNYETEVPRSLEDYRRQFETTERLGKRVREETGVVAYPPALHRTQSTW